MTKFEFNSRDPIYLQLIAYFKREIVAGNITPGQEFPSRRQIARDFNINPNTVQRALHEMEEKDWIFTEANRPSRLSERTEIVQQIKDDFLQKTVDDFVDSIKTLDPDEETVLSIIRASFKRKENGGNNDD